MCILSKFSKSDRSRQLECIRTGPVHNAPSPEDRPQFLNISRRPVRAHSVLPDMEPNDLNNDHGRCP